MADLFIPVNDPIFDQRTGLVNRVWHQFFIDFQNLVDLAQALLDSLGVWIDVTFDAANFVGVGNTWTVAEANIGENSYYVIGQAMTLTCLVNVSTITGASDLIKIKIPGGYLATREATGHFYYDEGAGLEHGVWYVDPAIDDASWIYLEKETGADWATDLQIQLGSILFGVVAG
jgi:hypothetical protein